MRRVLAVAAVLLAAAGLAVFGTGASDDHGTYKVRAIFMNAFSVIKGEDVKVAGVKVGKIESLDVTPDHKAAVVLDITEPGFDDFRRDAECTIRPQSLIGEKFVECTPTQPRPAGAQTPPPLRQIKRGPGKGQYLLPVTQTSRPVDLDLLNNTLRLPYRQRLSIILNELGTGLAGRGLDLRIAVRNADPALKETDKVLAILAAQNRTLAKLATDGDTILRPLARDRAQVADFVVRANTTAQATAERSAPLEQDIQKLPTFLAELKPSMAQLGATADQMTPVLTDLGAQAPAINRLIEQMGPFAAAATPALTSLGDASVVGRKARRGEQADHRRPRSADHAARTGRHQPLRLPELVQEHRRRRAPDGLRLLPGDRDQRLRLVRPLPARRPDPQHLLAVRDRVLLGLLGEVHLRQLQRPRRVAVEPASELEGQPPLEHAARARRVAARRQALDRRDGRHDRLGDDEERLAAGRAAGSRHLGSPRRAEPTARAQPHARADVRRAAAVDAGAAGPARLPDGRRRLMRGRGGSSIAANPVLIGAATTLIVVVAVFLAYNANAGLPFVPTYQLKAEVPSAANLVKGNNVKLGGSRVGAVSDITPVTHKDGSVTALLTLQLETVVKPLPIDSTVIVRPVSALGLKYVQLTKGTSDKGFQDGATIPLRNAQPKPVEFDEVLNTFDDKTRKAQQEILQAYGDGFAGRGQDLNRAIQDFRPLLVNLVPVMRNLVEPAHAPVALRAHARPDGGA